MTTYCFVYLDGHVVLLDLGFDVVAGGEFKHLVDDMARCDQ
jgi:hypothetical protein